MNGSRVLVVEDDQSIAKGLEYQLRDEGFEVHSASTGQQALEFLGSKDPHIVLLDIRLPDISGFDVCRLLRREGRTLPVLMLTALDGESDRVVGLELGADDYIVKPYRLREVVARIRAALRRAYGDLSSPTDRKQFTFGNLRVDFERMQVYRSDEPVALTPVEFRLLCSLISNPGQVFTRDALMRTIYVHETYVCDNRAVDVHVHHLRSKLESDPRNPRWFITVRGFGYKFDS